jgi:hypothetical protein
MQQLPIEVREFLSFIWILVEVVGVTFFLFLLSIVVVQVIRGAIDDLVRLANYIRDRNSERDHARSIWRPKTWIQLHHR